MYALWRQDDKALKDLQDVINTQDLQKEVCMHRDMFLDCVCGCGCGCVGVCVGVCVCVGGCVWVGVGVCECEWMHIRLRTCRIGGYFWISINVQGVNEPLLYPAVLLV